MSPTAPVLVQLSGMKFTSLEDCYDWTPSMCVECLFICLIATSHDFLLLPLKKVSSLCITLKLRTHQEATSQTTAL